MYSHCSTAAGQSHSISFVNMGLRYAEISSHYNMCIEVVLNSLRFSTILEYVQIGQYGRYSGVAICTTLGFIGLIDAIALSTAGAPFRPTYRFLQAIVRPSRAPPPPQNRASIMGNTYGVSDFSSEQHHFLVISLQLQFADSIGFVFLF